MPRKIIFSILLINFFILSSELNKFNEEPNNANSNQLLNSFIDNASLIPLETNSVRTPFNKIIFYSSANDNSIRKLKTFPKSLQIISETDSKLNNRYSTFMIMESSTGT